MAESSKARRVATGRTKRPGSPERATAAAASGSERSAHPAPTAGAGALRIRIVGAARSNHTDEEFRKDVEGWVRERAGAFFSQDAWDTFAKRLVYSPGDATDPKSYATLKQRLEGPEGGALFYLSTSPALYIPIVKGLAAENLTNDPNPSIPGISRSVTRRS